MKEKVVKMDRKIYNITEETANQRLDMYIASLDLGLSRSLAQKKIQKEEVLVNNEKSKTSYKTKNGDKIEVILTEPKEVDLKPQELPLDIIYEDNDILIINKEKGMVVHPGNGNPDGTVVNAVLNYCKDSLSGIGGEIRPGIVHRIDKNTSGLLVVAKNDAAHLSLSKQIEEKTCKRRYIALLEGVIKEDSGRIDTFIARSTKDRTKYAVANSGRNAITDFRVIERYVNYTLTEFVLQTGRTHQIRVHAKYIGHPVVGDPEYGYKYQKFALNGQLLHAAELELTHPATGERMVFKAPLPDYFLSVLNKLKKL